MNSQGLSPLDLRKIRLQSASPREFTRIRPIRSLRTIASEHKPTYYQNLLQIGDLLLFGCLQGSPPFGVWDTPSGTLLPELQNANPPEFCRIEPLRPSKN